MKRQLIALGLASILTVPTWVSLAHPLDASAKKATVSKKAKAVITKIKAIKSNKATYIKTTTAAKKAYNKLSKADKKKVSNYKTLQKHIKATAAIVAKANKVKKDAAAITNKNYKTTAPKVQKAYKALNAAGKAYLSASTVKKITSYANLAVANSAMAKLSISADAATTTNSAQEIVAFIDAYEKLNANQKIVLQGYQNKIDYFIGFKPIVKKAVAYDAKYEKLAPSTTGYLKAGYDLYTTYSADKTTAADVVYEDGATSETNTVTVAQMTSHAADIEAIKTKIAKEYAIKQAFEDAVAVLPAVPGTTTQYSLVEKAVAAYKAANATSADGKNLLGKPIDIVDKKVVTEYKKYENIPSIVAGLKLTAANNYDSTVMLSTANQTDLVDAGFTSEEIATIQKNGKIEKDKDITALDTVVKNYLKLGADQKAIVDAEIGAQNRYAADTALFKKGQTISKAYKDAVAKNDLAAIMKQFDVYKALVTGENRTIRYIIASDDMRIAPVTYKAQIKRVKDFETAMENYKSIDDIRALKTAYTAIEKDKPSGVKLIDSKKAKDYALALTVLDMKTTMAKVKTPYTTKNLNYILSVVKLYNKLDQPKKDIIDGLNLGVEDYALDEKNIKAAMDIDKKYLALKPASKNYVRDVKVVYDAYQNANVDVRKYMVNSVKIEALSSKLTDSKTKLSNFETAVNNAYEEVYTDAITDKVTVEKLKVIKNTYENTIKPTPKYNDLLDADVLKKYKTLAPIIDVYNKIFYLKPTPTTEIERENILTAIKAYNKLDNFGKGVIEIESKLVVNVKLLDDEPAIAQAKKIDAAYKAVKVGDKNYEQKIYAVYKSYVQAHDDVKNYVLNKTVLNAAAAKYSNIINAADKFEKAFDEVNVNSAIIHVHQLKDIYEGNKKTYPAIDQFIDADKLKMYKRYLDLLTLQDVSQIVYDQQLISGDWVKYDHWFYSFSQTQDHKNDVLNMRKVLLKFREFTPIQIAIINNSPNYDSYTAMKEDKNGDNIPIYGANGSITSYEKELNYKDKFAPKEVIYNPIDWLNYTQVNYVLAAVEMEKRYEALKPSSKTYFQDLMKLISDYNALYVTIPETGEIKENPTQVYFLYKAELLSLEKQYAEPYANAVAFEKLMKAYNPSTGNLAGLATIKTAYNKLDAVALKIVDSTILKTYQSYIAAEDASYALGKIKVGLSPATMENNANALDFIAKYNKLTADTKKIVQNENSTKSAAITQLIKDEKDIKAAQTVDKKYEALDKSKDTYEADVMKLYNDYAKLSTIAQTTYSVYGPKLAAFYAKYVPGQTFGSYTDNPSTTADYFTTIVNSLDSASPYLSVKAASDLYNYLSTPQTYTSDSTKKVIGLNFVLPATITKYKQYEGLVTIANAFANIREYSAVTTYTVKEKDNILVAIAAYKKLPKDARNIFDNDTTFGAVNVLEAPITDPAVVALAEKEKRYLVLVEADIKAAAAVDTKFQKIKKGDSSFAKNMIDAMKSYEGLTDLQKKFFTEQSIYKTYVSKYGPAGSYSGKVNTIPEGIKSLVDFEAAIKQAQSLHDNIVQTGPGATVTDAQTKAVIDAIIVADEYYNFMNNDFTIEGQKIRPTNLADSKAVTNYKTLMKLYKVSQYLNNLKK